MNFTKELIKRQKELGRPVRIGLAGAGQMGSGLAAQIGRIPGMELVACADIDQKRAENALRLAGMTSIGHDKDASTSISNGHGGIVSMCGRQFGRKPHGLRRLAGLLRTRTPIGEVLLRQARGRLELGLRHARDAVGA